MCDLSQYCKDPTLCAVGLSDHIKDNWDTLCVRQKALEEQYSFKNISSEIGLAIVQLPYLMIEGFLSWENLKIIGIFLGAEYGSRVFYNVAARGIAKGLVPEAMVLANEMAIKEG